jgi:hypothetical protein
MIGDAWASMDCDMHLPSHDWSKPGYPEIPDSLMSWEDAVEKYRPQGKMPGEPNYRPSFFTHWRVKLWRWRSIIGHTLPLFIGRGSIYKKTRRATIAHQLAKF